MQQCGQNCKRPVLSFHLLFNTFRHKEVTYSLLHRKIRNGSESRAGTFYYFCTSILVYPQKRGTKNTYKEEGKATRKLFPRYSKLYGKIEKTLLPAPQSSTARSTGG